MSDEVSKFAKGGVVPPTSAESAVWPIALDNGYVMRGSEWAGRSLAFKLVDPAAEMERASRAVEMMAQNDGPLLLAFVRLAREVEHPLLDWENEGGALA